MTWDSENIVRFEFPKVVETVGKFLRPQDRGFKLVYSGAVPNSLPTILYQSNQCKMRIQSLRDRPYEEIEIYISYGRLHAPFDKDMIEWNNESCYCWHPLDGGPLLNFLDGLSPMEANKIEFVVPRISRRFLETSKDMTWSRAEHFARKHAVIWEYYGQRLFDLFDVRYPHLWEEYVNFLTAYNRLKDEKRKELGTYYERPDRPPEYKVC